MTVVPYLRKGSDGRKAAIPERMCARYTIRTVCNTHQEDPTLAINDQCIIQLANTNMTFRVGSSSKAEGENG